ncbi:MAG: hypothetical protein AB2A00_23530 [Myxococcota bacterium]
MAASEKPPAPTTATPPGAAQKPAFRAVKTLEPDERPQSSSWLMEKVVGPAVVLVLILGGYGIYSRYAQEHPDLWVVNTSDDVVTVKLDGKVVVDKLPPMTSESAAGARRVTLSKGEHRLEGITSSGTTDVKIVVRKNSKGFLFAPGHSQSQCFALVTTAYGQSVRAGIEPLDMQQALWEMPKSVDRWLEESPPTLLVQKGTPATHDDALRMLPCENGRISAEVIRRYELR